MSFQPGHSQFLINLLQKKIEFFRLFCRSIGLRERCRVKRQNNFKYFGFSKNIIQFCYRVNWLILDTHRRVNRADSG